MATRINTHSGYPLLAMIDAARGADALPFATDPQAATLARRARELADEYWPNQLWLTGNISPALFNAVALRLEIERAALRERIRVFVVTERPAVRPASATEATARRRSSASAPIRGRSTSPPTSAPPSTRRTPPASSSSSCRWRATTASSST